MRLRRFVRPMILTLAVIATTVSIPVTARAQHPAEFAAGRDMRAVPSITRPMSVRIEKGVLGGRPVGKVILTSDEGNAECTFDGKTMQFGDGYVVAHDVVTNRAEFVVRLTAMAPDGNTRVAVARIDRRTGDASTAGMDEIAFLLSTSRHARLIQAALPAILDQLSSSTARQDAVVNAGTNCALLVVAFGISVDLVIAACAVPEPVEPYACAGAIAGMDLAFAAMMGAGCGGGTSDTIGWG